MTPVVITSPATAVPPAAAPQGAAPPGGVFAALFAALTEPPAVDTADLAAAPKGEAVVNIPALLKGATALAEPGGGEIPDADGGAPEDGTALPAMALPPLPTIVPPIPAPEPTIFTPVATGQEPATAPPQTTISAPALVAAAGQATEPVALATPMALAMPAAAATEALPVPPALQNPAKGNHPANPAKGVGMPQDDAAPDSEASQLQPATPARKGPPVAGDAKPAAAETKPPPLQAPAAGGGNNVFIASASADAALPLPITDASGQVKTVSLSNLTGLPNGAIVTAIGAVIANQAAAGTSRFLIRLDPPELGRVDVRLQISRDGEVRARLIADRPETVNLLMRDAAALERALNASGMRMADSGVDVMLRDSSGGLAQNDGGTGGDAPATPPYRPSSIATDSISDTPSAWIRPASAGGLDLTV